MFVHRVGQLRERKHALWVINWHRQTQFQTLILL
jgi:hypothetical protein